ncbi:AGE family epimerase/isomerase [Balneolaceae bacterium ANBcel3]|nr:AGE family epimerase/isomerase [Balneolaceae bacterium ANBcel3]
MIKINNTLQVLAEELEAEVKDSILPYWISKTMDKTHGGFVASLDNEGRPVSDVKSGILNTRLLWTFSAAYRILGDPRFLEMADYAMDTLKTSFIDPEFEGVYWSLSESGRVYDDKKHIYTQAFGIYGLSEYHQASGNTEARKLAVDLFKKMDNLAWKGPDSGYHEAYSRDWKPLEDARLGSNDIEAERTFNTHLHLVEAYTCLYRSWPDEVLLQRLKDLVMIHFDYMYDAEQKHILSYFDSGLHAVSPVYSYGHDIEAAWLLYDAALEIQDEELLKQCKQLVLEIAHQTTREGVDPVNSGVFNLGEKGRPCDRNKQWWAQAEALSGYLYAYQLSGDIGYLETASNIWTFTKNHVIDPVHGEWFYLVDEKGTPFMDDGKVGPWKCPYHTSRAALMFAAVGKELSGSTPFSILNH